MLYGGDYNPEQWPRTIWQHDMELLKAAHINELTLNVFSWAMLQPSEHTYDFSMLDDIVDLASRNGMNIVMGTGTGALPAWMALRYPDVNRVDFNGRRHRHGARQNMCPNSPTFLRLAPLLAGKLAERYGSIDRLVAWHVSNEYEGICYCDNCAKAYRIWLRQRYGDLASLNKIWGTSFWGHQYTSFEEIFPPDGLGDGSYDDPCAVLPAASLDYARFFEDSVMHAYHVEKEAIRRHDITTPITTNFMGNFYQYDYSKWADDIDVAAWDCYPRLNSPASDTAFWHDLVRSLKQRPFLLMEQTPSRMNWMPYNELKAPGLMRKQSWQAIAHGADSVQFFQMRRSRFGCERYHGAVIDVDGTNQTRTYQEVAALGAELAVHGETIAGSMPHAQVAIIFDWSSWRSVRNSIGPSKALDYLAEAKALYAALYRRNIAVDVVRSDADLAGYAAVFAPMLTVISEENAAAISQYVHLGGRLLLTSMSGICDEHDTLHQGKTPAPFHDVAGIWAMETDALPDSHTIPLLPESKFPKIGAEQFEGRVLCDVLRPEEGTQVLAKYGGNRYYAGSPAVTRHVYGDGACYYSGTFLSPDAMQWLVDRILTDAAVQCTPSEADVSISTRHAANGMTLTFVINDADQRRSCRCPVDGVDLLDGAAAHRAGETLELAPYGVMLLKSSRRP